MTKKDYELIAKGFEKYIRTANQFAQYSHRQVMAASAMGFAQVFENENPRFDSDRFLKACGLSSAEISRRIVSED